MQHVTFQEMSETRPNQPRPLGEPRHRARKALVCGAVAIAAFACGSPDGHDEASVPPTAPEAVSAQRVELVSDPILIDRIFASMDGPSILENLALENGTPGDLLWLTGIENQALAAETGELLSQEFLCHSNLALNSAEQLAREGASFSATANLEARLMTLIQGQNAMALPPGFGLPVIAGEPLSFFSMVINKNESDVPFSVRVRTTIDYVRDQGQPVNGQSEPIVPLFRRRLFTFLEATDPAASMHAEHGGHGDHGEHSGHGGHGDHGGGGDHGSHGDHASMDDTKAAIAPSASVEATLGHDAAGNVYTMHWLVPPGRHEYRNDVTRQLQLPFDTTAHYVTAHLHPYGESIALVDRTTGETLFSLEAEAYTDRVGIADMESFSSIDGATLARDHEYELVTVYDNTTDAPIDAMGIVYLHLRDHAFSRTSAAGP